MPKRSTPFQAVVYEIRNRLAEKAQSVTESAMLRELSSGDLREVDVVLSAQIAGQDFIVSFECRQHTRKQGVDWVEEMHSKHSDLPTNLLVLVSYSGFYERAKRKAARLNIRTITPGPLEDEEIAGIIGWIRNFSLAAVDAKICPPSGRIDETSLHPSVKRMSDWYADVHSVDGSKVGDFDGLVTALLYKACGSLDLAQLSKEYQEFQLTIAWPTEDSEDCSIYVEIDHPVLHRARLSHLYIKGEMRIDFSTATMTPGKIDDHLFSFGEVTTEKERVTAVLTKIVGGDPEFTIRIEPLKRKK
jgi:hypothetical protein